MSLEQCDRDRDDRVTGRPNVVTQNQEPSQLEQAVAPTSNIDPCCAEHHPTEEPNHGIAKPPQAEVPL